MTINEKILDASIRHMVWLERFKTGTVNQIIGLLNKSEKDLRAQLAKHLTNITDRGASISPGTIKRIEAMLKELEQIRSDMYKLANDETRSAVSQFAIHEADFQGKIIENAVKIDTVRPTATQLRAAAVSRPFQGALLKEWYSRLESNDARRLRDAVKIGITQGQTTDQIVRRVVGTRANAYRDGILEISRREAQAVVRTAIAHTANQAKEELFAANSDIIEGVQWVSTLDSRTSPLCQSLDGKIFEIGKGIRPPAHFNCRSTVVPYLGKTSIVGTRASAVGQVPADMTYSDWLKKQPRDVQDEVLGKSRADLFRNGMAIDRFVDNSGRSYTLKELKQRDEAIWNKAFAD